MSHITYTALDLHAPPVCVTQWANVIRPVGGCWGLIAISVIKIMCAKQLVMYKSSGLRKPVVAGHFMTSSFA